MKIRIFKMLIKAEITEITEITEKALLEVAKLESRKKELMALTNNVN